MSEGYARTAAAYERLREERGSSWLHQEVESTIEPDPSKGLL